MTEKDDFNECVQCGLIMHLNKKSGLCQMCASANKEKQNKMDKWIK